MQTHRLSKKTQLETHKIFIRPTIVSRPTGLARAGTSSFEFYASSDLTIRVLKVSPSVKVKWLAKTTAETTKREEKRCFTKSEGLKELV